MSYSKKISIRVFILLPLVFCTLHTWSQKNKAGNFLFQGVVYGYHHDPSRGLIKKNKPFIMEGLLSGVTIHVYDNDKLIYQQETNNYGELRIAFPLNGLFKLELSKEGYSKNILQVDTRNLPKAKTGLSIAFTGAEFMLNSFIMKKDTEGNSIGRLYFDPSEGVFAFDEDLGKNKKQDNSVELIRKAILKNKSSSSSAPYSTLSPASFTDTTAVNFQKKSSTGLELLPTGIKNISPEDIPIRKKEIEKERTQLEEDKQHALSKKDSIIIDAREAILHASEIELQNAFTLIQIQKSEISSKRRELYITFACLLLLAGSLIVLYIYYRDKKRTHLLLEGKNRNILDSITYAKRIQQSILVDEEEIKKIVPGFFIYNQPKDIVSGDFYWFSEIDHKLVFAVVDCTGHGVPGAFMSVIAHTLLNEIVNEKRITDPALILKSLHTSITNVLQQEKDGSSSHDGMDMALCIIDKDKSKIEYAGAINPLYVVHNNVVDVIKADIQSIGGRRFISATESNRKFTNHTISIQKGMSFYMFSDGYVDQFGGETKSKFGAQRFRQLLLDIHTHNMTMQKILIQETMKEWRNGYKQIDDILVMGIKI